MEKFVSHRLIDLSYPKIREVSDRVSTFKDVISLGIGEPDCHTDPIIIEKTFQDVKKSHYTHYTPMAGLVELREEIATNIKKNEGISVDTSEVIVTSGSQNALINAFFCLLDPGDEILVSDPFYPSYISQIKLSGSNPVFVPTFEKNNFKLDVEEIEKRITKKTKAILLNSPNNPTGAVLEKKDLEKISKIILKYNIITISDEAYEIFVYDGLKHVIIACLPGMKERTVIIRSFSKSFAMTGWRIGYAIAEKGIIDNMIKYNGYTLSCPAAVSQRAALAALARGNSITDIIKEEYKNRRDFIIEELNKIPGISCNMSKGAFYAFPNILKTGKCSEEIYEKLLVEGKVAVIPGSAFGRQGDGYLRIAYTLPIERLSEVIERIRKVFKQIHK